MLLALTGDQEDLEVVVPPPDVLVLPLLEISLGILREPRPFDEHPHVERLPVVLEIQRGSQVVLHARPLVDEGPLHPGIEPLLVPDLPIDHRRLLCLRHGNNWPAGPRL